MENIKEALFNAGMRVEVILTDEGLAGSRYAGRVIEMEKNRALVEFEVWRSNSRESRAIILT